MVFYAAVPLGLCLGGPGIRAVGGASAGGLSRAPARPFSPGRSWRRERGEADDRARGQKSFFYAAGIIEGTETICAFVLFCLFPGAFPVLAAVLSFLCFWTVIARLREGYTSDSKSGSNLSQLPRATNYFKILSCKKLLNFK